MSHRLDNLAAGVQSTATEHTPELMRRIQNGDDIDVDTAVPGTPIVRCDARRRDQCKAVLLTLLGHAIEAERTPVGSG